MTDPDVIYEPFRYKGKRHDLTKESKVDFIALTLEIEEGDLVYGFSTMDGERKIEGPVLVEITTLEQDGNVRGQLLWNESMGWIRNTKITSWSFNYRPWVAVTPMVKNDFLEISHQVRAAEARRSAQRRKDVKENVGKGTVEYSMGIEDDETPMVGDWVQVWAQVTNASPHPDEYQVRLESHNGDYRALVRRDRTYFDPDVRPEDVPMCMAMYFSTEAKYLLCDRWLNHSGNHVHGDVQWPEHLTAGYLERKS